MGSAAPGTGPTAGRGNVGCTVRPPAADRGAMSTKAIWERVSTSPAGTRFPFLIVTRARKPGPVNAVRAVPPDGVAALTPAMTPAMTDAAASV